MLKVTCIHLNNGEFAFYLTATRCQYAASGRTRDGRLYRSGPAL